MKVDKKYYYIASDGIGSVPPDYIPVQREHRKKLILRAKCRTTDEQRIITKQAFSLDALPGQWIRQDIGIAIPI